MICKAIHSPPYGEGEAAEWRRGGGAAYLGSLRAFVFW